MDVNVNTVVVSVNMSFVISINVLKGVNPDTMFIRQILIIYV